MSSVKRGLTGSKSDSTDEFLVQKKDPLILPPDFESLPSPEERILAADMPVIPLYHYAGVFMLNTQLKGWPYDNVEQNWYSRNLYKVAN